MTDFANDQKNNPLDHPHRDDVKHITTPFIRSLTLGSFLPSLPILLQVLQEFLLFSTAPLLVTVVVLFVFIIVFQEIRTLQTLDHEFEHQGVLVEEMIVAGAQEILALLLEFPQQITTAPEFQSLPRDLEIREATDDDRRDSCGRERMRQGKKRDDEQDDEWKMKSIDGELIETEG